MAASTTSFGSSPSGNPCPRLTASTCRARRDIVSKIEVPQELKTPLPKPSHPSCGASVRLQPDGAQDLVAAPAELFVDAAPAHEPPTLRRPAAQHAGNDDRIRRPLDRSPRPHIRTPQRNRQDRTRPSASGSQRQRSDASASAPALAKCSATSRWSPREHIQREPPRPRESQPYPADAPLAPITSVAGVSGQRETTLGEADPRATRSHGHDAHAARHLPGGGPDRGRRSPVRGRRTPDGRRQDAHRAHGGTPQIGENRRRLYKVY